ncbi:type II toxin-antitoxin system HicA family toxin [Longimicrobium terrae]|uniref:Type II toxin-antitoxin system HicA family toxin n=1 Tax=Longimicrobium terrae TaxID=1639882 RepID=A0A841GRT9_9BACT|nr:type II toxin-antitoxin system HicA family toxin [Longimicrobium terrae]MBB4635496.1 hypothetical protein [Longimicrobium terrae]MBB6069890.1 hypothetical protein [Longimicrobium terrae]NNC32804.1 type II toxin-antitoxin system HicA family toxin [Longimicrobium terrae]
MNSKQRRTLTAIFEEPARADVVWTDIESLFATCGGVVSNRKGSRVNVILNGVVASFHRPHPEKETDKGALRSVKRFLLTAGIEP